MSREIPMEMRSVSGNSAHAAIYQLDSHYIEYANKTYFLKSRIHDEANPTAEMRMDGRLKVWYKNSDNGPHHTTQYCEEIKGKKRKSPPSPPRLNMKPSPPSPPLLNLDVMGKCYEFVQALEGKRLAPMTGSKLEAQLLISRVDASREVDVSSDRCFFHQEFLPLPLDGITEEVWNRVRSNAFS